MNSAELTIDGYKMFTNDLEANNRGILVYVKEHLSCKQIFLSNIFGEYVLLQLDVNKNKNSQHWHYSTSARGYMQWRS